MTADTCLVQAALDLDWYFVEGRLHFDTTGRDYDRPTVQSSGEGDVPNDRRHRIANRYFAVRARLVKLPAWQQQVLELRYAPVGWAGEGDLQQWWGPYGQWANMIRTLKVEGDNPAMRITNAKRLLMQAIKAYCDA
jgi:hypothetical protein